MCGASVADEDGALLDGVAAGGAALVHAVDVVDAAADGEALGDADTHFGLVIGVVGLGKLV